MASGRIFGFGSFRLDEGDQTLRREGKGVALPPKEFAVLLHLVERPRRLVTKEELLDAVWPGVRVSEAVLKVAIGKIRKALDDDAAAPRFIETAHRRGYRFIGDVTQGPSLDDPPPPLAAARTGARLAGREAELALLGASWSRVVAHREQQTVFLTGEAGIGKTALVDAFLEGVAGDPRVVVGRGQCLEQYGAGEPYLPVLEALGRLARGAAGERLRALLSLHAPTWLCQMPSLVPPEQREALGAHTLGATRERMLREMDQLVEALTAEAPLLLVLEDLHWSDASTLDLVAYLSRRREPAPLLIIGTHRLTEVLAGGHPLHAIKRELRIHRRCAEVPLSLLPASAVAGYLARRFVPSALPPALAETIHRRTEGNPLFMVNMMDYLVDQGSIAQRGGRWELVADAAAIDTAVPGDLEHLIEKQLDRVSADERRVLDAASAVGRAFSVGAVAAALDVDVLGVEALAQGLAVRRAFLELAGVATGPGGAETTRYAFAHSLYERVLYERLGASRRALLHLRLGAFGEALGGEAAREAAAEIAMHFERGHDDRRALPHICQAADNAARRHANAEAVAYLRRALALAARLPAAERYSLQAAVHEQLGVLHRSIDDMVGAAGEFEAYAACAREAGDPAGEVRALIFLSSVTFWFDRARCLSVAARAVELARRVGGDVELLARGSAGQWRIHLSDWSDEDFEACAAAFERLERIGERVLRPSYATYHASLLCMRSEYRAACVVGLNGMRATREVGDAFMHMSSQFFRSWALLHLGEWGEMHDAIEDGIGMADRNDHALARAVFELLLAWHGIEIGDFERARVTCESIRRAAEQSGLETYPLFLSLILLAAANLGLGRTDDARHTIEIVSRTMERRPTPVDWPFRRLTHHVKSRILLAQGDLGGARAEATDACRMAEQSRERTYTALARRTLAQIAMARGDHPRAEAELSRAEAAIDGVEMPLAGWRVHATAAELYQHLGRRAEGARSRALGARVLGRLAASLATREPLRAKLLQHPEARALALDASGADATTAR